VKFSGKVFMGHWTNDWILVAIRITDPDPDRDTGKTCLGGGMYCPSASSLCYYFCHRFGGWEL